MSTAQLQLTITSQVLAIKDENLLQQVLEFLQKKPVKTNKTKKKKKINIGDPEHPYYNKLTQREIEGVREAMKSYEKGEYEVMETTEDIENFVNSLI